MDTVDGDELQDVRHAGEPNPDLTVRTLRMLIAVTWLGCASVPGATDVRPSAPVAQISTGFSPGLIDTLTAIAGAPRAFVLLPLPEGWLGAYIIPADIIVISPEIAQLVPHRPDSIPTWHTRISPDWVLSHEFGHRFDRRRGFAPSRVWMRDAYRVWAASPYSNKDVGERWAEAFANAIDFLRFAATDPGRPAIHRSLAARELFVPGTADVVDVLLRHRIYARHPLNRWKDLGRR